MRTPFTAHIVREPGCNRRGYGRDQLSVATSKKPLPNQGGAKADLPPCPPALLDEAPGGGGLGVWVLVESSETTCTCEYAGGIA